ncbi:MAG: phospholipid carrier-dependent glycosyltransferase [Armatimonadetes bacterium]|nr:phospholipid carrier-dependent glycosyltransferase [Armatimonadota bacterium]
MGGELTASKAKRVALALAMLHAVLALIYAAITPYCTPGVTNGQRLPDIGAPDEYAHAAFVRHLSQGRGLPVLRPGYQADVPNYESHQPPLFYALDAVWGRMLGVSDPMDPSSGLKMRSLNALFGALTVFGVFWLALWTLGSNSTALLAAALVALLPMLCALDGALSNDPLSICLATWILALTARWRVQLTTPRLLGLGALLGLALLTKSSGLLLFPVVFLALLSVKPAASESSKWPKRLAIAGVAPALGSLVALPWLLRNQTLYGDLLGLKAFHATFERQVDPQAVFSGLRPFGHWVYVLSAGTLQSSVGEFGYMDIHLPYEVYVPLFLLLVVGLVAGVFSSLRHLDRPTWLVWLLYSALLLAGYVSYNLWQVQPQARYLFPAIGILAIWIVLGLQRVHKRLPMVLIAGLAIANVFALGILPTAFAARVEAARTLQ